MPVGKGSLNRAAKANGGAETKNAEVKGAEVKNNAKPAVKKAAGQTVQVTQKAQTKPKAPAKPKTQAKQTAPVEPVVAAASVITGSDSLHEKKFEAISKITCELPTYLL